MREQRLVTRQIAQRDWVTVRVRCDRCGEPVRLQLRSGDRQDVPGVLCADLRCDRGEHWTAELCADCTDAVREFVDAGPGPGVRVMRHDPMGG